jgi:hypothetical protein
MRLASSAALLVLALLAVVTSPLDPQIRRTNVCELRAIFDAATAPSGTMALTPLGELADIDMILVPKSMDVGMYGVTVSRAAQDLYHVDGTQVYITTAYCNEYTRGATAVLRYAGGRGAGSGKLEFRDRP